MHEVFDAFAAVMRSMPPDPDIREAFVFATWKRVAGELLCEHAVPARFDQDVLHIAVSNIACQKHLADQSPQMLFKLNAILGNGPVRRIVFVIEENYVIATRERPAKDTADEEFISLAERETTGDVMRSARQIEDDDLRNAFLLAAGRCLARRELHYKAEGKQ